MALRNHDNTDNEHPAFGTSTVTRKGQITIPAEIRQQLGLTLGEKVSIRLEGRSIVINRTEESLDRLYGILQYPSSAHRSIQETIDTETEAFERGAIQDVIKEMESE